MGLELEIEGMDLEGLEGPQYTLGPAVPPSRGRRPAPLSFSYVRDLGEQDILLLIQNPSRDVTTPSIKRLKTSHHNLARLLASGTTQAEASLITGYSPSRISILLHDPAFSELMAYYAEQTKEIYVNVHQRLADVGTMALEEIQERLEEQPEKFSTKELLDTLAATLDRGGYGPKSTIVHQQGGGISDILDQIKAEAARRNENIKTLDVAARRAEASPGPGMGNPTTLPTLDNPGREGEGSAGQGENLRAPRGEDAGEGGGEVRTEGAQLRLV